MTQTKGTVTKGTATTALTIAELQARIAELKAVQREALKELRTKEKTKTTLYKALSKVSMLTGKPIAPATLKEYGITANDISKINTEKISTSKYNDYPIITFTKTTAKGKTITIDKHLSQSISYQAWASGTGNNGSSKDGRFTSAEYLAYIAKATGIDIEKVRYSNYSVKLPNGATVKQTIDEKTPIEKG